MTFKLVIRNLLKRPFLNLIKVLGLGLAFCGILLMVLFIKYELTFDTFHEKAERIYRLTVTDQSLFGGRHFARVYNSSIVQRMAGYFPEIESYVRLAPVRGEVMKYNEDFITVNQAFECDSTFFKVFNCELLSGNPEYIFDSPGSMLVSESFALRVFGKTDPEGQIMILPEGQFYGKSIEFTVKGVMKDFPANCHFHPEFLVSPADKNVLSGWSWIYILVKESADADRIKQGFKDFFSSHAGSEADVSKIDIDLQKITDIHLLSNKLREIEPNSSMSVIYAFSIAVLILFLIALANYANLNIGMAGFSDKYLFVSRVSGASDWLLIKYFLIEGFIILFSSLIVGAFLSFYAGNFIHKHYALNLISGNSVFIACFVMLFSFICIMAGMMPLIRNGIDKIKSAANLKNGVSYRRKGLSKGIVVLQYTISIVLIVAVLAIRRQTSYSLEQSLGYSEENIICLNHVHSSVQKKFGVFKEELLKFNSVQSVSAMFEPPGGEANDMFEFQMEGYVADAKNNTDKFIGVFPCDYSFTGIFNINILAGIDFSESNTDSDGYGEYLVNETAMKRLHFTKPDEIVGKSFRLISNIPGADIPAGKIIGVTEDFHLSSLKKKVDPLVLFKRDQLWLINFVISFDILEKKKALDDIKRTWENMFPGYPFQYEYVGPIYEDVYRTELLQVSLLSVFTFMALFICSMGMLGLTLLTTQRRTKELGVRKINGARTSELMLMLNMDLLKWILLAFILALPLAWFSMHKWLESFAYRISLSWWIYAAAGLTAFIITFITVSIQSLRAARRNPVDTLRYE